MLHFYLALLISLAVTGQTSKAPASSQNNKQTPDWLEQETTTTSSTSRVYTPVIDMPSVNLPTEETVWEHGDSRVRVTWDGLDGTLVKVQLLQNGSPIADVINWSDNNNSALIEGTIQSSWGSGSGFQVRVEDNIGNSLTSETFRIMAPINVSQPRITTVWSHAERDVIIAWSGSPGNAVDIVLFDGEYQVATLGSGIPNTGSFSYPGEVSSGWGTGDNYTVRITDDIGNEYTSRHFSINAINVTSPTAGTVWSDQNPTLNVTWDGGSRVVRIALYRASTKIKELTEWIDNTGYCEIGGFLSHNLDAGSNYRIEVRDDQGDQGFSHALSVSYSQNTQQGAMQTYGNSIEGVLPPNGSMYFSTNLPSGHYRISIDADDELEVSFQRSNGSHIKDISSSENNINITSSTRLIQVSNSSSNENVFEITITPLHEERITKHHFFLDFPVGFFSKSGGGGGVAIEYHYNLLGNLRVALTHANLFCGWNLPDSCWRSNADYRLSTTCLSTIYDVKITKALSTVLGIGYSLNTVSIGGNEDNGDYIDTNLLNRDGLTYSARLRWSASRINNYNALGFHLSWRYCEANGTSTLGMGILCFYIDENTYVSND